MAPPTIALVFLCFLGTNMIHSAALERALKFQSADAGQTVTLECDCRIEDTLLCYWFKQTLGLKPKLLSTFFSNKNEGNLEKEFKDDKRFSLDTGGYKNNLMISGLSVSDSATYFCVASSLYTFEFCEGITVIVRDWRLPIRTSIRQSISGTNQTPGSVTLDCTVHSGSCDGEHTVYWFKSSGDSHLGLVHTHGDGNGRCERKPGTQPRTCSYELPMSQNQRDAGTYYCAVVACGHIVFGNGTTPGFNAPVHKPLSTLAYFLSAALAFTIILVLSLAFTAYKLHKRLQCADSGATLHPTSNPRTAMSEDGETLHYAAVRTFKVRPSTQKRTTSECVYSSVK
ncbi:unnamed protein product [Ophioblennius macclurei]